MFLILSPYFYTAVELQYLLVKNLHKMGKKQAVTFKFPVTAMVGVELQ